MDDPADYCRQLEAYLCRKNEGHLIRIVGPVFEQVCGWAAQGVPLAVAFKGIDRYCERYYAKGPRRRPVRIEFCEADILELFDDWRRAVGVMPEGAGEDASGDAAARRDTLPAHIDRAIARLTAARAGGRLATTADRLVDEAVRELDRSRAAAKSARGGDRAALIDRLGEIDRALVERAAADLPEDQHVTLRQQAAAEVAPFAPRMAADAHARAVQVAFERLVREELGLPVVTYE
jgi:hypothetical protein